jgi:hypothetical protein
MPTDKFTHIRIQLYGCRISVSYDRGYVSLGIAIAPLMNITATFKSELKGTAK